MNLLSLPDPSRSPIRDDNPWVHFKEFLPFKTFKKKTLILSISCISTSSSFWTWLICRYNISFKKAFKKSDLTFQHRQNWSWLQKMLPLKSWFKDDTNLVARLRTSWKFVTSNLSTWWSQVLKLTNYEPLKCVVFYPPWN